MKKIYAKLLVNKLTLVNFLACSRFSFRQLKGRIVTLNECAISIFIFEGDPTSVLSQKCFLETHDHNVKIIDIGYFDTSKNFKPTDIVLLDMELENPLNFPVLDMFLSSETRPKLLLTAFEDQIFKKNDFLSGGPAQILFKPFSPADLIEAVTELSYICHG